MTPTLLAEFIMVVNPRTLLQKDNKRKRVLHFIKYRRSNKDGKEKSARKDDVIAALNVGVAKVKPSLTQVLLQQSAEHAYVSAAKGLILVRKHAIPFLAPKPQRQNEDPFASTTETTRCRESSI